MIYTPRRYRKFGLGGLNLPNPTSLIKPFDPSKLNISGELSNETSKINNELGLISGSVGSALEGFNTKNQYGEANSSGLNIASGALQGAAAGAAFGPIGAGAGAIIGGLGSITNQDSARKRREIAQAKEVDKYKQDSITKLQTYNSYGTLQAKYGTMFHKGNSMPEVIKGGNEEELASNVSVYNGRTHERGGITLDINNDNTEEIEIEDNEVIKDNMVLSDKLVPSESIFNYLRNLKVKKDNNDTYATVAEKLGRKKGNWEKKLDSSNTGQKEAARRMIGKYDSAIDNLFEDQEIQKEIIDIDMKKFGKGGTIDPKPKISRLTNQYYKNSTEYTREQYQKGLIPENEQYTLSYFQRNPKVNRVISGTSIDKTGAEFPYEVVDAYSDDYPKSKLLNPIGSTAVYDSQGQLPVTNNDYVYKKPGQEKLFKKFGGYYKGGGKFFNSLKENTANIVGTVANQGFINQLETNIEPAYSSDPISIYTDRTNYIKNTLNSRFTDVSKGLNQSSAQSNLALKSSLYADTLNATNSALDQETQRKDALGQQFQQLLQNNRQFNTQNTNYFKKESLDNRNQKIALTQQNIDNSIRGVIGNKTQRDLQDLDFAKTVLNTDTGETGVDSRFFGKYENSDNIYLRKLSKLGKYKKSK